MEKLSQTSHFYKDSADGSTCEISRQWYEEAKDKLAAYEDTGLTPEQCAEPAKEDMPAAIDRLVAYESAAPLETVQEWVKAHEDGRLVVLLCKVGQDVYTIEHGAIYKRTIDTFTLWRNGWQKFSTFGFTPMSFPAESLGKTVFLTREAAEAKLKEATQ